MDDEDSSHISLAFENYDNKEDYKKGLKACKSWVAIKFHTKER